MSPLAINRRLIWVAAGAIGAGAYLFVRHKLDALKEQEQTGSDGFKKSAGGSASGGARETTEAKTGAAAPTTAAGEATKAPSAEAGPAGERELAEFLAGDSWYDEGGWRNIWEREGVEDAAAWLQNEGKAVLQKARTSLSDHPALLAGCRRRWIVVCRYAGIDVSDAAALWNETDA